MNEKEFAKKYLIISVCMLTVLTLLSALIIYALECSNLDTISMSLNQKILLCVASGYIPASSFSGFCICFKQIKKLNLFLKLALTVFFPITLVGVTLAGIIILIPSMIKSVVILIS